MELTSSTMLSRVVFAALFLRISLTNGLEKCNIEMTTSDAVLRPKSCDPLIDRNPPTVVCEENHHIPLPNVAPFCNATSKRWQGADCYRSKNIANERENLEVQITNGGNVLVDGDPQTYVNVSETNPRLPSRWDIFLGRQYVIYAVFVLFSNAPIGTKAGTVNVRVQTRYRINGTNFRDDPCVQARVVSQGQRYVFYCLPTSTDDSQASQKLFGRLAQNVLVSVHTSPVLRLAEIQVYENQGLECGKPSSPWETVYKPIKSRYSVGDEVEYSCKNSSFVMFGNSTRQCGSDGRWVGYAPLCRQVLLLGNGMFEVNSINGVLHDQNTTTCFQMGNNNKLRSVFQKSIDYEIRLKNPAVIGQISIEVSGIVSNDCMIEIPSHPDIVFIPINQNETQQQGTTVIKRTLSFVPRIRERNEDGSVCHSDENPGQLIQSFVELNKAPNITLRCHVNTVLCEIRILQVHDIINRCGTPESPLNSIQDVYTEHGIRIVNYTCDNGFRLLNSDGLSSCPDKRQWNRPPICERISCRTYPPNLTEASLVWRLTPNTIDPGSIAHYFQPDGSQPSPAIVWKCDDKGNWVDVSPRPNAIPWVAIIASGSSLLLIIVVIGIVALLRRRKRLRKQKELTNNLSLGPSPSLPNRPDSTIYEEIDLCHFEDKSKTKDEPRSNEYSFKFVKEASQELFPRPTV